MRPGHRAAEGARGARARPAGAAGGGARPARLPGTLAEHSAAQRRLEERLTRKDCSLQGSAAGGELMGGAEGGRRPTKPAPGTDGAGGERPHVQEAGGEAAGGKEAENRLPEARRTVTEMQHPCRGSAHPRLSAPRQDLKEQVGDLMAANRRAEQDVRKLK